MLTKNSLYGRITIVGTIKNTYQNGTEKYQVFFSGPFTPRYGECVGNVAGYEDCDKETFDDLSKHKFPYVCTGCIFYDDKRQLYKLAGVDLAEVKS